jgi:hypothetical protein
MSSTVAGPVRTVLSSVTVLCDGTVCCGSVISDAAVASVPDSEELYVHRTGDYIA